MHPAELDTLLATLRKHGVASAEVPTTGGLLRLAFEPSIGGPLPEGDPVTPGGWKSPERLDAPDQFSEVP